LHGASALWYDIGMSPTAIERNAFALILNFADGRLARPTRSMVAKPARIDRDGDRLVWLPKGKLVEINPAEPYDAVYQFMLLADANETEILAFARSYGPLWVCKRHQIAAFHAPLPAIAGPLGPTYADLDEIKANAVAASYCSPEKLKDGRYAEPLETWRQLARRAKNLLTAASKLKSGESISADEWHRLDGFSDSDFPGYWSYLTDPWWRLAENLNWWLAAAQVRPFVAPNNGSLRTSFGTSPRDPHRLPSVLSVIAVQIIFVCQRNRVDVTCAGCGQLFPPKGQPMPGQRVGLYVARRNYCPECRGQASVRDAKAAQRNRDRKIWNLAEQSKPIDAIAKVMKLDRARVEERIRRIKANHGRIE
jgi:transposase-like protein